MHEIKLPSIIHPRYAGMNDAAGTYFGLYILSGFGSHYETKRYDDGVELTKLVTGNKKVEPSPELREWLDENNITDWKMTFKSGYGRRVLPSIGFENKIHAAYFRLRWC